MRKKIKNKNLHETVNRSLEIVKRPPKAQGRGWGGFFGLRGPWHNALRHFLRKKILGNIQSVWFLESHTLKSQKSRIAGFGPFLTP